MNDAAPPDPAPAEYTCPSCAGEVLIEPQPEPQLITCPLCGSEFVIPAADGSTVLPYESPEVTPADGREDELDGLRIRKLAAARRSTIRARSHCWIGIIVLAVFAIQLVISAISRLRARVTDLQAIGYLLFAILAGLAAWHLYRKTRAYTRELAESSMQAQPPPPVDDSSLAQLGDGSQRWKDLENLR